MTSEALQNRIRTTPFRPFVLNLADGEKVPVRHPEFIAHVPGSRTVFVGLDGEDFRLIDLLLIVSISPYDPAQARPGEVPQAPER